MTYKITKGIIERPQKIIVYGVEGIGKTTFAADFPNPLFIDTEGGSNTFDVARLPKPTSWAMLMDEIRETAKDKTCKTLVIDTIDWAERMCIAQVCNENQKHSIEDFGYGTGYVKVYEEFGRLLNLLNDVIDHDINVLLVAHAMIYKFEQPGEMGAYDRYTLKLNNSTKAKITSMLMEWADMVLFANYETIVVKDNQTKKNHAAGRKRIMYTTHYEAWDAKNRFDLPDKLDFDFANIKAYIPANEIKPAEQPKAETAQPVAEPKQEVKQTEAPKPAPVKEQLKNATVPEIPKALADLMTKDNVTEKQLQHVVGQKGYFPADMPVGAYPQDFIDGCIIPCWTQIADAAKVPF